MSVSIKVQLCATTSALMIGWRALVIIFFLVCSLLILPNASASTPASLTVSPGSILSGGSVNFSGSGFPANSSIMLWLDANGNGQLDPEEAAFPQPIKSDANGLVASQTWNLVDVPAGLYFIQAGVCPAAPVQGLCFGTTGVAQTQLTITFGVSHSQFGSGSTLQVTGYGFQPNAVANVWYDADPNGPLSGASASASPSTDANGAFSASLLVKGNPGNYYIHAGASTSPTATLLVNIGTCWFQDCFIDGADTICLVGNSPSDLGTFFSDCKQVDSNYTIPNPITQLNTPPGGYDLTNKGPIFLGAGVLAAATVDLGPPGSACISMTAAIANAEGFGNSVPDKLSLLAITCGVPPVPPVGLELYISSLEACVFGIGPCNHVPDKDLITAAVLAIGGPAAPPPAQLVVAEAAVAGAIACGFVNFYCNGSDITRTILENPGLQTHDVPITFLQPPFKNPPSPNPCAAAGTNGTCWGDIIGWSKVTCKVQSSPLDADGNGVCEQPDANGNYSQLAVPGSAGSPHNSLEPPVCTSGKVIGLSIGYDGDVSFDLIGPKVLSLVNYHNFLPGPGGSEPPNGIDIEIPVEDRPLFMDTLTALRPGMSVQVCGRWVADMHMKWNELHPVTSLSIVTPLTVTANDATQVYGGAAPAFTASYNGFANGDTPAALGGTLICTTTATPASSVGNYPITCSGQTSNTYDIEYVPGNLAVTPAALTVSANNATRLYGSSNPAFTTSPAGLINGDTLASIGVNPMCSTLATISSPVGSYPITCSGPSSSTNYTISYQGGTLMITPASLTITAQNNSKLLHAPNPAPTASYSGLVNGDTPASLSGTLSCITTATIASPVGSYPITCSGQSSTNYNVTYVPGILKILYASTGICDSDPGHQILPPINANGSSVGKLGRTIPAKFRVCDANGVSIGTPGVVQNFMLVQIISGTVTDVDESVASTTPDTAFRWDSSGQQWIFNINTGNLQAGQTYVYSIQLNDGSAIGFAFGLK